MTQFRRFTATNVTVRGLAGFSRLLLIAAGGGAIAFAALAAHAVVVDIGIWGGVGDGAALPCKLS